MNAPTALSVHSVLEETDLSEGKGVTGSNPVGGSTEIPVISRQKCPRTRGFNLPKSSPNQRIFRIGSTWRLWRKQN
ncbi:hypothetical protein JOF47_000024 [Paeniglutamicibacter kerguelensis]|uniref:Uncharacterized protein n=1 Tax=Paeniglutamicibacter kerguelensis TaxID=254788 RepID=A0ABS4X813_9MICC|nr:hypothetical protein [Paeniglutamicibacter kerguelensis]